jgi:cytochrome P450
MIPSGWTFSNGDHIPQGSTIHLPVWYVQTDESVYENSQEFDGFRFVNDKHPESAPSDIFMAFGHGHHAW